MHVIAAKIDSRRGRFWTGITTAVMLLIASFVGLSWVTMPILPPLVQQWLHPDSKLAFGEEHIAHIPAEFIRRSRLFADSWDALAACSKYDACDATSIVALRDEAIKLDWPKVFDYLVVKDDWGEEQESAQARDQFFATLAEKGEDTLRNRCLPNIKFEIEDGGRFYEFLGFTCT